MMKRLFCFLAIWTSASIHAADQLPDPTRPFGFDVQPEMIIQERATVQEQVSWNLSGIRIADKKRSAILNGRVVRVGDIISGARVLEIEPAWVVIEHEKKHIRLELLDIDIKRDKQAMAKTSHPE